MLDGVDSCFGSPENPLRPMGMGCDFAPKPVSVGDDGFHLLQRVLRRLRIVALGEHPASSANLHDIGAVLDDLARLVLDSVNAICRSLRGCVALEGEQVVIAVTAGDSKRGTTHEHSRPRHKSLVDSVPQSHIAVPAGSYIADGGKAGFERNLRIAGTPKRFHRGRDTERLVAEVGSLSDQVGMCIDQAGYERRSRQIDNSCTGGNSSRNCCDPFSSDYDDWRLDGSTTFYVEHVCGSNNNDLCVGRRSLLTFSGWTEVQHEQPNE